MFLEIHREEKAEMSDDSSSDVEASSAQPTKKGLSKYYKGKSQSFTSISEVASVEDLAKKRQTPFRPLKSCKSYAGGMDDMSQMESPRAMPKKGSWGSCAARGGSRPPNQKNF